MDVESHSPLKVPLENDQDVQDATDLAGMGHAQALTRKFSIWSMLALAFCVLGMLLLKCFCSIDRVCEWKTGYDYRTLD